MKQSDKFIKENIPYFKSISRKYRYSDVIKDKAWTLLSDFTRCRDFILYGTCISSGTPIQDWREGDAGHFYTMSSHGASLGFSDKNVHLQAKIENKVGGMASGARYRDELVARYGEAILSELEVLKNQSVKADWLFFADKIMELWGKFQELKRNYPDFDYPDYL